MLRNLFELVGIDRWMAGSMDGWIDGWLDGRMAGLLDGWMDG